MKLIDPFFQKLKPQIDYLSHEVIMAQAWKKTHAYMRTHNWYADTLALDISALGLETNARNWAKQVRISSAVLNQMELVPAAKSEEWVVDDKGWRAKVIADDCQFQMTCPGVKKQECSKCSSSDMGEKSALEKRIDKPPLRPLAHLTVRDQTWATAAVMCLADVVESVQGDCNKPAFVAQKNKVYSYGNRLLCDWKDGSAWFRWGNSQTYRKFFTDYQAFLKRPVLIGQQVVQYQGEKDHVFVVSLDLEKFYDHICRLTLSDRLKKICVEEKAEQDNEYWQAFSKIIDWKWEQKANDRANDLNLKLSNDGYGLPQGLVASGFLANAYMVEFDRVVGAAIHKSISGYDGIFLHDYCRYVDDLRLVISIDDDDLYEKIQPAVNSWISSLLLKYAGPDLALNEKKTRITALSDLDNSGTLSERVKQLQQELSGPTDRDSLESSMGVLEGLLSTPVEALDTKLPDAAMYEDMALIRLSRFDHDMRTDTLKRFAANRLETIMRNKRKMSEHLKSDSSPYSSDMDNESELVAKKLVWAWMKDPSLALVLRKAIEIFPSPDIMSPVLSAIYCRCSFVGLPITDKISSAMADYLLADLFRCCSEFYGYFQRVEYPSSADPDGVLSVASQYAQKALAECGELPEFVRKQAMLLLAILNKPAPLKDEKEIGHESIQESLHRILAGLEPKWHHQRFALYEVAAQITDTPDVIASQLLATAEKQSPDDLTALLDELAKRGGPFWDCFWSKLKKSKVSSKIIDEYKWAAPLLPVIPQKVPQHLSRLLMAPENPFFHEAALIKLARALLKAFREGYLNIECSPAQIKVHLDLKKSQKLEWSELWREEADIFCTKTRKKYPYDIRFKLPDWLREEEDVQILYWLGTILRAVVVGIDFTGNRWKKGKISGYKGLRTGWYKRRMGMMHAPEALVGEYATLSRWTSELLMKCLQWPGFESTYIIHDDLKSFDSIESLDKVLKERLVILNNIYCRGIDAPALITRVERPESKKGKLFRFVAVQSLLPNAESFTKFDPALNTPQVKAINRDHLARVCQLTYKTLQTKLSAEADEKEEKPVYADLIVFPELAVHPDDQDILKKLADKTRSMVFAGLTFVQKGNDLVNVARWFLPDYRQTGRQWMIRDQGKKNPTNSEKKLGILGRRPCQHIIEVHGFSEGPFRLSGAICYDSTDLKLAADLKGKTDLFVVAAHNRDVNTFDTMASALHYHMYQHVAVVNKGEYGGTTIQAPYKEQYDRLISHVHGGGQISVNVADLDLAAFRRNQTEYKSVKTPPAEYK